MAWAFWTALVAAIVLACVYMSGFSRPTVLASGTHSSITSREVRVVGDAGEWETLWKQHRANVYGGEEGAPAVDFGRRVVVAAFAGNFPTGGYTLEPLPLRVGQSEIVVRFRLVRPPADAILTQAFTQPFCIVTLPRTRHQIRVEVVDTGERPDR